MSLPPRRKSAKIMPDGPPLTNEQKVNCAHHSDPTHLWDSRSRLQQLFPSKRNTSKTRTFSTNTITTFATNRVWWEILTLQCMWLFESCKGTCWFICVIMDYMSATELHLSTKISKIICLFCKCTVFFYFFATFKSQPYFLEEGRGWVGYLLKIYPGCTTERRIFVMFRLVCFGPPFFQAVLNWEA